MSRHVYADYAAATPMDERVAEAMKPYFSSEFYNPSALYGSSRQVKSKLETGRSQVASLLGVRSAEVIFVAGGTEANNLALQGVARYYPASHIIYSSLEHESVRAPIEWLKIHGWSSTEVRPGPDGRVRPEDIVSAITDDTALISVMYANNEIGTIQPLKEISQHLTRVREERQKKGSKLPLYLHTDACQAANYLPLQVHRLGVDLMTLNGGKIYGPKQSGVLVRTSHTNLLPLILGGGQEGNYRSGTENVANAIGFSLALRLAQETAYHETKRLGELQSWFFDEISARAPQIVINGSRTHRLPNNIHLTIPGMDNERLMYALDERGIQCATGSACSASKEESSHTLLTMGKSDDEARGSIRITLGRQTDKEDVEYLLHSLLGLL